MMTKQAFYDWNDIQGLTQDLIRQLNVDNKKY